VSIFDNYTWTVSSWYRHSVKLTTVGCRAFVVEAPHVWNRLSTLLTYVVTANSLTSDNFSSAVKMFFFYSGNHILTLFTDITNQWFLQWLRHLGHFKNWLNELNWVYWARNSNSVESTWKVGASGSNSPYRRQIESWQAACGIFMSLIRRTSSDLISKNKGPYFIRTE